MKFMQWFSPTAGLRTTLKRFFLTTEIPQEPRKPEFKNNKNNKEATTTVGQ